MRLNICKAVYIIFPIINALYDYLKDTNGKLTYYNIDKKTLIEKKDVSIDNIYLINASYIIRLLVQPRNVDRNKSILEQELFSIEDQELFSIEELNKMDFFYNKIDVKQQISRFSK
jgi:hypothetical protein